MDDGGTCIPRHHVDTERKNMRKHPLTDARRWLDIYPIKTPECNILNG